jgi:hypothetical protein
MFYASRWAEVSFSLLVGEHVFHFHPGGAENENLDLVERLGAAGDARGMDGMVGGKIKAVFTTLTFFLQGYGFVFISYSFFRLAHWVGFGPVDPSSTWNWSSVRYTYYDYMRVIVGTWIYGYDYYNIEDVWDLSSILPNVTKFWYGDEERDAKRWWDTNP